MSKIVTANSLATGSVVFLTDGGAWTNDVTAANLFADAAAAEAGLVIAERDAKRAIVVDPFVTDRAPGAETPRDGMTLRDSIRAFGPTISFLPEDA